MKKLLYIWLLVLTTACNNTKIFEYTSANFELVSLSEGVYALIHKLGGKAICNTGIIDNGSETIIFDTFLSPDTALEILHLVDTLNLSPIKYVVNSHWHNDHIRGNQVFPDSVKIISTKKTAEIIALREPMEIASEKQYAPLELKYYDSLLTNFRGEITSRDYQEILMWKPYYEVLSESHKKVKTRLPNMFIDKSLELNGSLRKVQLVVEGEGHTESDLILYLPDDNIVFSGDLIFNRCHPYMGHGSLRGLKNWYHYLRTLNIETIVPGHGEIGDKQLISNMTNYIESLEHLADSLHQENQPIVSTYSTNIPKAYKDWWFGQFFGPNVNLAYIEYLENDLIKLIEEKLLPDSNHTFLKTLRPTLEESKAIFKTDEIALKVFEYSELKWNALENVSENSMKPTSPEFKIKINRASGAQLDYGLTYGLPMEYLKLGSYLKEEVLVFGFEYLNPDDSSQKSRAAFYRSPERWVFIPQTFKAFEDIN